MLRILLVSAAALALAALLNREQPIDPRAQVRAGPQPQLHFEPNRGQASGEFGFVARGRGYGLYLAPTEAVLALRGQTLRMKLLGADASARLAGTDELGGKSHYFVGNDRSRWIRNVPNYARVVSRGVYDGVDLVYYGREGELEYDFVVAPGADWREIGFVFEGADDMDLDADGNLVLSTQAGAVTLQAPTTYQEIDGVRRDVSSRYALDGDRVGFEVGTHDPDVALVIDPVLSYSTYLGGFPTHSQTGNDIKVDAAGNFYVVGRTTAMNFPVKAAFQQNSNGDGDVFVTKFAPDGTLVYSTYLGGSRTECVPLPDGFRRGGDSGHGLALDADMNVYVCGKTQSLDFPTTAGAYQDATAAQAISDQIAADEPPEDENNRLIFDSVAFVTKLNPSGSGLVYSTYIGLGLRRQKDGGGGSAASDIAVDASGCAHVVGSTRSNDYPTTPGAFQTQPLNGRKDGLVTKLNPSGSELVYSTLLGGSSEDDTCNRIALDSSGNAYVTGWTDSADFPTTQNAFQGTIGSFDPGNAGGRDGFVTKLNLSGSGLVYSTYLGGDNYDIIQGIDVDAAGNAYVTGETRSNDYPVANPFQAKKKGRYSDAFVTKLSVDGTFLVYSTFLGGSKSTDWGRAITVDGAGCAHVTGQTLSDNFPTVNPIQGSRAGSADGFVSKFSADGSSLVFSTFLGGSGYDESLGIALDSAGNIYVTGLTQSADFPTTDGALENTNLAPQMAFVSRIDLSDPPIPPPPPAPGVVVDDIVPNEVKRNTPTPVTITGSGFQAGATVTFVNGQGPKPKASVTSVNGTTIEATVTVPKKAQLIFWDVRVTNPDGSVGVLVGIFKVIS